jgi:hypothetical protein
MLVFPVLPPFCLNLGSLETLNTRVVPIGNSTRKSRLSHKPTYLYLVFLYRPPRPLRSELAVTKSNVMCAVISAFFRRSASPELRLILYCRILYCYMNTRWPCFRNETNWRNIHSLLHVLFYRNGL